MYVPKVGERIVVREVHGVDRGLIPPGFIGTARWVSRGKAEYEGYALVVFADADDARLQSPLRTYAVKCEPAREYPLYTFESPDVTLKSVADDITIGAKPPKPPIFRSTDSATRKRMPVTEGVLKYFPDALLCVSFISKVGNDKHNPGEPLHWAKEKSTDESDCEVRHMLDYLRGIAPDPGLEELGELGHLASKAWRALAHLQRACDAKVTAYEAALQASAAEAAE